MTSSRERAGGTQPLALGLWIVLLLAAVPRLWAAWFDHGVFWPDEIFQSLEQGHRLAFGYGVVPWEFRRGARSWVFPGALAGLLELGALVGLDSGRSLVLLAKSCMAAISLAGVYLAMKLARSLAGPVGALCAGLFAGFFPASILLGSRCSAETVSGPIVLGAAMLAMRSGVRPQLAAGALAGLSIYLRYQTGLVAVALLAITLFERRFRDACAYALSAGVIGVLGGMLDWATWGAPFQSFRMYLWFNLFKSADKYGAYPFAYYAEVAWNIAGPATIAIAIGLWVSARLAPKLLAIVLGYVLVHCIVPHKEFRFLMSVMPLAFALAGAGLARAVADRPRGALAAGLLAAASAAWMLLSTTQLTWAQMGFPSDRGERSPWHSGEGINRLLWSLGERADVCGVIVTGESFGWIGGYSYFHRDVDMFSSSGPAERAAANYYIGLQSEPPPQGYSPIEQQREFGLFRRQGDCSPPPPDYRRELPY